MRICVLSDDVLRSEFLEKGIPDAVEVVWADTLKVMLSISDIDVYFDLLFTNDRERTSQLLKMSDKPVFINAVNETLHGFPKTFYRINAWPTMLKRKVSELAIGNSGEDGVASVFNQLQWEYAIVPDITGMLTPRVVSMIINEAYFALQQDVSSKQEIDIAMKLGTNYPMGPFEWGERIGLDKVLSLLEKLSKTEDRYVPAELLKKEAGLS